MCKYVAFGQWFSGLVVGEKAFLPFACRGFDGLDGEGPIGVHRRQLKTESASVAKPFFTET